MTDSTKTDDLMFAGRGTEVGCGSMSIAPDTGWYFLHVGYRNLWMGPYGTEDNAITSKSEYRK
jgi:hypothetical protein